MHTYTLSQLRTLLQSVRGETRIKTQETAIRNTFLQSAIDEIFEENDFEFNKRHLRTSDDWLEYDDTDGTYTLPDNFSALNDYGAIDTVTGKGWKKDELEIVFNDDGTMALIAPTVNPLEFFYYILPPQLEDDDSNVVYFPQGMLIAERAYVRLKVAYMPDQPNDKEYARSRTACRLLAARNKPRQNFTPGRR